MPKFRGLRRSEERLNGLFLRDHLQRIGVFLFLKIEQDLLSEEEINPRSLAYYVSTLLNFVSRMDQLPEGYSVFNIPEFKQRVLRSLMLVQARVNTPDFKEIFSEEPLVNDPRLNGHLHESMIELNSTLSPEMQLLEA